MPKTIFVSPNGNHGWKVKQPNSTKSSAIVKTQTEGIAVAIKIANNQKLEMVVQRPNGQIITKNTYPKSRDPRSSKG